MDMWPSDQELADDLKAKITRIQKWRVRRKIPSMAWPAVLSAAKRRGFSVDAETLLSASVRRPVSRRESRMSA